ncbi:hypothetical protein [Streptomyces virginiae]|uniref:hypothetical protein n=1 Tax=Streptomyces virginiae TaxID=1961 RepID=UPI003454B1DA
MNGTRTRRLVLITASAALAVGTVSLSSSAFAAPRSVGTPTASAYTGDDSPDPDTAGNGTGGHATGGDPVYRLVKSIKRTLRSDHPTSHVSETPAKQRTYTTKSSPAVRSSGVVLWF